MNLVNKLAIVTTIAIGVGVVGTSSAQAASINRSDFDANAINFNFESALTGATSITDGNLSVNNGRVLNIGSFGLISGKGYYDGGDSSVIRFDFLNPVSAFGLDFIANNADITLSIFDNANNLIESLTLNWRQVPNYGYPSSFIGLNAGSNSIAYATIDTPLAGNELYVDNLIYQSGTAVPEPSSMLGLAGAGVFGAICRKKRKQKA